MPRRIDDQPDIGRKTGIKRCPMIRGRRVGRRIDEDCPVGIEQGDSIEERRRIHALLADALDQGVSDRNQAGIQTVLHRHAEIAIHEEGLNHLIATKIRQIAETLGVEIAQGVGVKPSIKRMTGLGGMTQTLLRDPSGDEQEREIDNQRNAAGNGGRQQPTSAAALLAPQIGHDGCSQRIAPPCFSTRLRTWIADHPETCRTPLISLRWLVPSSVQQRLTMGSAGHPADHGTVRSVTENAPTAIRHSCGRVVMRLWIFEEGATMPSPNHAWSGATGCRSAIRAQWIAGVEAASRTEISPHAQ